MGVAVSRYSELSNNELLTRFCSAEPICPNDPFWNQVLAFNITLPGSSDEQLMFDSAVESLLQTFLQNNPQTGNLGSLVQVFITRATELLAAPNSDNVMLAWQTFNAVFMIRSVVKYLVEMVPDYELCRHLDVQASRPPSGPASNEDGTPADPSSSQEVTPTESKSSPKLISGESRVEMLIDALIGLIIDVPITDNTYYLHLECINTLLVLMSVYMFASILGKERLIESSLIYRTLFQGRYGTQAALLVKTLLNNLSAMLPAPPQFGANSGGSLLINIASGLWNMITFAASSRPTIYTDPPPDRHTLLQRLRQQHPVANQSCLLLLALSNHCVQKHNLYRAALLRCEDSAVHGLSTIITFASSRPTIYTDPPPDRHSLLQRLRQQHPVANQSCLLLLALSNHCVQKHNLYRAALLRCEDSAVHEISTMITFAASRPTIYTDPPPERHSLLQRLRQQHPVANQSCLLLLALSNHCVQKHNLYRAALLRCEDSAETSSTTPQKDSNGANQVTPPRIDMAALHKALCATAGCEHSTLLLYLMLHSCKAYKKHVSNSPHIENLIVPILQVLYNAQESNSHHIYMSLIVLLILTEDDHLIRNVHLIMLKNLTWYTERSLSSVSLGGLMVLVVLRALQYNMARVRDKYLHTNCLAAVANMSCEFRNLHPYVAQRLVSLFETLSKRRARLCNEIEGEDMNLELPHHAEEKTEEIMEHIAVLDEVLRMLLEIINSCLTHQLSSNLNLVYALLHKRQLFQHHQHHHIAQNIEMVIGYFSTRLQRVQEGAGGDLGVTEVLACIKKGAEQWSSDRLKKFPDLKFRYVEEERPEEFFTPYVWALSSSCGGVYWASECGARLAHHLLAD